MRVLVACEESQVVTKAFRAKGHEAYSCDLQECSGGHPEWHIIGDAIDEAYSGKYDMMIAHPPCTYLANSGVSWLKIVDGKITNHERKENMLWGRVFFMALLNAPIPLKCVENPIPHKHAELPRYTQIIQPYHFGHPESKATCLWLSGLPELKHTNNVKAEWLSLPKNKAQRLHHLPPGPDRAKERSKTFAGIAQAMADQWG